MSKQSTLFAAFIRQYQGRLRSFIRGMGVAVHAVDDIAQETFLTAYKKLDEFDQEKDFGNWLYGIARNILRNELRKNARQNRIMDEKLSHFLLDEYALDYEPSDQKGDEVVALQECIQQLPEKVKRYLIKNTQKSGKLHHCQNISVCPIQPFVWP
ncbi:sigma-70 family RNA polymerase sigma factor [Paraglaciecola aquimarina]|uniref:Sigma-70 family RNA polymerase sigma factor n=1 Tax=Paraglaciecola aquimarina TaxID=1235557 RepID=A0ABU3SUG0_9ALTE|nr:sigma-70 family RNA polymerase sigma factor [Paraglaciecola aquimarina]MDU0353654.1 sigma-70 family RNA polymerase sigma factor [Paraglaciecola aquimarina]